ncbi:hypothetical protein NEOLEDRAFT_1129681 [Neolentinus lepideus HHB14362 ss-1]|uniref:ATPase dynein-related AAA domain-containing protein n=1 Tax=Neolentinus lepideus HHB14362 ss-1 TaxID=1314782 RepID=A0A165UKA8_9AGAM|nr:hypothetical protein NEOLEDRAFT_1129681 [Neolentinus lepideus HHB14362 ss-1]
MAPQRRLNRILSELAPSRPSIGTLRLGDISYEVPAAQNAARLPRLTNVLDVADPVNADNLHFMLQKYLLGQDIFLLSQPGPYARRLAMMFCSLINSEYEYIALHRDIGETELKQGREIKSGGNLVYVDSPAVQAVKLGRILIIEGIEKAERGIMPVLNNLLENREMNLDDGTHIIHPHRYELLEGPHSTSAKDAFIPAHRDFRVVAIAAPVPPYKGYPLDPPFRSRFQARFIDPVGSMLALTAPFSDSLFNKLRTIILSTQYASESRHSLEAITTSSLAPFPQTALSKLSNLIHAFPPSEHLSSRQLSRLFLSLHPALVHAPFQAWALLSQQTEEAGLGPLGNLSTSNEDELEDELGFFGFRAVNITKSAVDGQADVSFQGLNGNLVKLQVPCGPKQLQSFSPQGTAEFLVTKRFTGLLTSFLQVHGLGYDISYIPPVMPSTASCSTSLLVKVFSEILGYESDTAHMYKELGGRELVMRRKIEAGGATSWEPSPLIEGALKGRLVHLSGMDVIGSTAGSLARLAQDREIELWEGKRIVAQPPSETNNNDSLSSCHASFRIVVTASKSQPLRDWLSDEHANMFFPIPVQPMSRKEESTLLLRTGCPQEVVKRLLDFASKYRESLSSDNTQKNRRLGTSSVLRIANRIAKFPWDQDLRAMINRSLLAEFLPAAERISLESLYDDCGLPRSRTLFNPPPSVENRCLIFPKINDPTQQTESIAIPQFDATQDLEGAASHVPYMDHYYDNSLQTGLMRDVAIDMEVLDEHVVILGNQGVGKNKILDRLCQLLKRPREYVQLHRDTTVNQLMFQTSLEGGVLKFTDSPLLRAITYGRVIIVDEADKAPEHVVAIFKSLAAHGELTLSDGRRVRPTRERDTDVAVHPNFRLILLANRPGYPFLGNHFLQVLGDSFSCHSLANPDVDSERKLLCDLAPELDADVIKRLVYAFHDLRRGYEDGSLNYPYSLRELINIVRHMRAYPKDPLEVTLRNIFDFDVYKRETIEKLADILEHHGLTVKNLGLEAARETTKKILEIKFEPEGSTELSKPKFGKEDPENEPHTGGNTWAGGTGGRDTAGLGGRGGYMRLYKGHDINQISDKLKNDVPDHIKEKAREMAREELARKLEALNMTAGEAQGYGTLLTAVQAHIAQLYDLLENLSAKEEERVWVKRQTDGELDDSRLTEGLTGETTVYKRRGIEEPEMGRPQIKPKRIRFLFDISGSMYRFQYDGRLQRSLEAAIMLMETFDRLTRKDKYVWDMFGHSGDSPVIPLVESDKPPKEMHERWKVVQKMDMTTQYSFAGDYTVEAIEKSVLEVGKFDADDWFVIAITDANFERYGIKPEDLKNAMNRNPKVHSALICIGEGAEAKWIPRYLQGRAFRVSNAADIPNVLRSILSTMVDR